VLGPFNGLNEDENPHALNPNDLVEARNCVNRGRTTGTRPGTIREPTDSQYENVTTGGNPIQGLHEHRENVDTGRHLIAVGDNGGTQNVFYEDDSLIPNDAAITGDKDNVWTFASHNNKTYGAGGAATDDFWVWDGVVGTGAADIAIVDSAAAPIRPNCVFAWRNYLFINALRGGVLADNNTSVSRFCDFATDPTVITNWSHGNTIGFTAFGNSFSTGFGTYEDNNGDFLLLLHNDHIESVVLDPRSALSVPFFINDKISNGCVSQRAFVPLGLDAGDAVYMSDRGIHSLRQSQEHGSKADEFLSWKIRPTFASLNNARKKYAVGAYDYVNGYALWAVSTGSETAHDKLLVLDVKDQDQITARNARWAVWDISGRNINELKMMRDQNDVPRLYFGTTVGDVGYFSTDIYSDVGDTTSVSGYTVSFQNAHNAHNSTLRKNTLGDVSVTLQPGGSYKPQMRFHFDYGARTSRAKPLSMASASGGVFGSAVFGVDVFGAAAATREEKVYGSGSGYTVGFSVMHSGVNEPFWVSRIGYEISDTGESTGDSSG
jgi:hypothetical protein